MPGKQKKICKRKVIKKPTAKSNSLPSRSEKKTVQDENTPATKSYSKKATPKKNTNCCGKMPSTSTRPSTYRRNKIIANTSAYRSSGLTSKEKNYMICSCQTRTTRYLSLKCLAWQAVQNHKIFAVYGNCKAIRKVLVERGWVEKIPVHRMNLSRIKNGTLTSKREIHGELERLLLSSFVDKYQPNFIWRTNDDYTDNTVDMARDCVTIENKLRDDGLWTSKQGLCTTMKRNYWFYIEDVAEAIGPRSYNTYDPGEVEDFVKDYKTTACTSLLKWVLSMVANDRPVFTKNGKIPLNVLVFALNRCKEYLFRKQNRDIDHNINTVSSGQWNAFLRQYYLIIKKDDVFQADNENKLPLYLGYATFLLKEMYRYRPQLSCEGCHNIWIIKPAHNSRGRGIRMASKLGVITNILNKANSKYVIQKYIEEPLLIHGTKFDIRQYYLVTSTYPLIIWMYKDCYLKFSSQTYNLMSYHESIHLTNNAVQRKYKNCPDRHPELPHNNMWDSDKYKSYLNDLGRDKVWDEVIYPGMKKSIIGIMLGCQDYLAASKNRFELYGCDFVIDKMYNPWLIEINSCPDLNHTTPVTAKICPAVIADLVKVILDYPYNRNCSTGRFECIYHQPMTIPKYGSATDMVVRGYALPNSYFYKGNISIHNSFEDDFADIEKADNSRAIMEKIKQYYDIDTVMKEPDESDMDSVKNSQKQKSTRRRSTQSEYELSIAATIITTQLEELMDKLPSENSMTTRSRPMSHSPATLSQCQSIKSFAKIISVIKNSMTRLSSEITKLRPRTSSKKIFLFSELDDGPDGKGSTTGVNTIKSIFDDYSMIEEYNQNNRSPVPRAKTNYRNIIRDATSEIFNFISQKQKEYLGN